jgi:FkbM family methyltransferase
MTDLSNMKSLRSAVRDAPLLSTTYRRLFRSAEWKQVTATVENLYAPFITKGSLVFDVGANVGDYSRCFLELGAKVVAIEPAPPSLRHLRFLQRVQNLRGHYLSIAATALESKAGTTTFYQSQQDNMSSCRADWLDILGDHGWWPTQFTGHIEVPVTMLDTLIDEYGVPVS